MQKYYLLRTSALILGLTSLGLSSALYPTRVEAICVCLGTYGSLAQVWKHFGVGRMGGHVMMP